MNIEDQAALFSIFHDGSLLDLASVPDTQDISFVIECKYIVEMLIPGENKLYGLIKNCHYIFFEHWDLDKAITDLYLINQYDLEIHDADVKRGYLNIICLIESYRSSSGGTLYLKCDGIELYDENRNKIAMDELKQAANLYWSNFKDQGNTSS
ncbi:hypothetical protein SAMN04487897_10349 [Paenibacillus sp. yr247]|uniref:hypothetical protein n=1 Tax=Paenibacillus sp. yr247 TaxID=1761880 RepID=UPI00088BE0B7|nr:hypothetical protein [Paenibacillus sp. yr247]SDN52109.1 hypothetical protein SAMN04487897_10349 [Paenibacillus sp. yr247]